MGVSCCSCLSAGEPARAGSARSWSHQTSAAIEPWSFACGQPGTDRCSAVWQLDGASGTVRLIKGTDGTWTAIVGPLEPNRYGYAFLVDGVRASDPSCRCSLMWANRAAESTFIIPADPPKPWEPQGRPAGVLHHEQFFSSRQQLMRRFIVYTPPDYESSAVRAYPLLVLLPGTPGDERDWTSGGGFAEVMFDNLIAEGRMVPMVVVMHASDVLDSSR